ncbi:MAG: hypothetical protein R6U66_01195 [Bacteroidales bacterium]
MERRQIFAIGSFLFGAMIVLLPACKNEKQAMNMQAPDVEKKPKELTVHGDTRIDNYYWLNDRENPDVIAYLEAENAYTKEVLAPTEELQEKLFQEMRGRIKEDDESVPYKRNGYFYYTRYEEGKEYPIYCRKKGSLEADEEVMLNVNDMAKEFSYYQVGGVNVSPDNKLLAFGVDTVSRRKYTIHIKNLETGEIYPDRIPETTGSAAWANDNKTLFYTRKNEETLRSEWIYRHSLGTDAATDNMIYHEDDETFSVAVYNSKSRDYIMIASYATLSSEYRFLDANTPNEEFQVLQPRERGLEYSVSHFGNHFYIVTNWEANNFRLMKTPVTKTTKDNWKEVIAHRKDVFLEGIEIFKNYLVVDERKDGLTQLRIRNWESGEEYYMDFGEEVYTAYVWYSGVSASLFRHVSYNGFRCCRGNSA